MFSSLTAQACCVVCWLIAVCLGAGGGAPWQTWDDGGRHGWPMCVLYLSECKMFTNPSLTNNQPPIHRIISTNNWPITRRKFLITILCTCMVGRCLCSMVAGFHYLGVVGGCRQSIRNDGRTCYQIYTAGAVHAMVITAAMAAAMAAAAAMLVGTPLRS